MALPRPSCLRGAVGRSTLRKAGQQARSKSFRDIGRRTYASGHEAKKSSDIPWIIGSLAVTVPAATWLLGQAPAKSDHGHGEEHVVHEEKEEGGDEGEEQPQEEESKDRGEEKPAEEFKDETKEEGKEEESKSDDSGSDGEGQDTPPTSDDDQEYEPPGPNAPGQINKNPRKGPGEGQKGDRKKTETKGEKDSAKDYSGAQNPRLAESGRSQKAEGVLDTAKIHGTVDPKRNSSKE